MDIPDGARPCTGCEGGTVPPAKIGDTTYAGYPHSACGQLGYFLPPDVTAIAEAIKGRKAGTLRSKPPESDRAYYVWRMARFHGGADVTMPIVAGMRIHNDPFYKDLDLIADEVAKVVYGTDLAAAARWGKALGYLG